MHDGSQPTLIAPAHLGEIPDQVAFSPQNLARIRDEGKKRLAISQLYVGRYTPTLLLRGELTTDGITFHQHEEYGDKYSFGIRLEDPQDAEALNHLVERLDEAVTEDHEGVEWDTKLPFRAEGDVLYLKCKTNPAQTAFAFQSNLKLHPKKPNPEIYQYMPVEVEVLVGAYFGLEDNTRGIYFTVRRIDFKKPVADVRGVGVQTEGGVEAEDAAGPSTLPRAPVGGKGGERVAKRSVGTGPSARGSASRVGVR